MAELDDNDGHFWNEKLRPYAERHLRRNVVPPGRLDANDVVQSTWVELNTAKEPIQWADRYAYTVALRTIHRAARESHRSLSYDGTGLDEMHTATPELRWDSPVENSVLRRETAREIAVAKIRLTPPQRNAVEGTVERGLSRAEVAADLGVQTGTVSAHRARGLQKLRMHLAYLSFVSAFLLFALAVGVLTEPPEAMAGGVGTLIVLLIDATRRLVKSLKESHDPRGWAGVCAVVIGLLGLAALLAWVVVVSRATDGTPGLDYASGDRPTLDRINLEGCLHTYPRCPGNVWWWHVEDDEAAETTFHLKKHGKSRSLRGVLDINSCDAGSDARWSITADSRKVASGTLICDSWTGGSRDTIDFRQLERTAPQDARTLDLTVRPTDSALLTWTRPGVE